MAPTAPALVAAAILTTVYRLLRRGVLYIDLGADHFERTERTRLAAASSENSPNSASKTLLPTEFHSSGRLGGLPRPPVRPCPALPRNGVMCE
jgi:hypothetical protein